MPVSDTRTVWDFVSLLEPVPVVRQRIVERIRFADPTNFRLAPPALVRSDSSEQEQMVYWAFETGRMCPVGPVELICIENAIILKEGLAFFDTGECVLESLHPWTPQNMVDRFGSIMRDLPDRNVIQNVAAGFPEVQSAVHLREPGETGYFHWINSVMPRAALIDRVASLDEVPLAVDRSTGFARQSLDLLGLASRPMLPEGAGYRVKRLWMMTPTNLRGDHFTRHPYWTQEVRRKLAPREPVRGGRKIYVSRNDSKIRRIKNEKEILGILSAAGFESVVTSGMTMMEQVSLFNSATVLISPHGAGLSNSIFMPRGLVIELVSRSRLWPTFRTLAARCGQEYAAYITEFIRNDDGIDTGNEDIVIALEPFRQFMSELEILYQKF